LWGAFAVEYCCEDVTAVILPRALWPTRRTGEIPRVH